LSLFGFFFHLKRVSKGSLAIGELAVLNIPIWSIFPQVSKIREGRVVMLEQIRGAVKQRKELLASGQVAPDDCLGAMLAENMPENIMLDHFITLVAAGHDTTAYFSAYFVYLLGQHPDIQDRIRDEMNAVMGDRTDVTADDVSEMKYLAKAMQECLRLYAIIPNVTRTSAEDVYIKEANITIPKGANVFIPMFLINRDPDLWENPSDFNPDRFEGKGKEWTIANNGFFPFGYGNRVCIGNLFAQLESSVFMFHLLRKFRIEPDPGFRPNIMSGISLTTSNGINVVLKEL
jgi:cytochrome P450